MRKSLESNEVQQHTVMDKKDARYIMKYIPYSAYYEEYKSNWWASYAIEMVYNNNELIKSIFYQKKLFARSLATISILYFGFLFMIINLVQKNNETAYNDHLTKLPNRKKLEEVMEYKMIDANKKDIKIAILFFDLDKFKMINDEFGHNVGDKVLQEVANRIKNEIRKGDMICRLGGDEFVALISNISSKRSLEEIVERMSSLFKNSIKIDSEEIFIEASIGISIYPDHGDTIEELITKADKAMYEAKQRQIGYKIYKEKP